MKRHHSRYCVHGSNVHAVRRHICGLYCGTAIISLFPFVSPLCPLWLSFFSHKGTKNTKIHKEKSAIIGILLYRAEKVGNRPPGGCVGDSRPKTGSATTGSFGVLIWSLHCVTLPAFIFCSKFSGGSLKRLKIADAGRPTNRSPSTEN